MVYYLSNCYLVDIVSYDNLYIKYISTNNIYITKIYLYNIDLFLNILSNDNNCNILFKNSNWLFRECIEFFGLKFYNIKDSRNLLNDYSLKNNFLLNMILLKKN